MKYSEEFYKDKKVLITGHTGFKGTWMCKVLQRAGANVTGYALRPQSSKNLFEMSEVENKIYSVIGDVRDLRHLMEVFDEIEPEIVIHMAAQPIVRESYRNPVDTYETNVMGTVNVLECIRHTKSVKSFVNVTTDKVYKNKEWEWGYRENDELNGYDPYSNSKSCSEIVTSGYKTSFFNQRDVAISTCRAGNVIGGGDFSVDRIIPDCVRAIEGKRDIIVRNPYSIRPYQHVLEPILAYLLIAQQQYIDISYAGNYNIGPEESGCLMTGQLVELFCKEWNEYTQEHVKWRTQSESGPHEANYLKLDCSRIKRVFGWKSNWNIHEAVRSIVEWTRCYMEKGNVSECMDNQIAMFIENI